MKFWHLIILFFISIAIVWVVHDDVRSTPIDYISGVGSVASIYAIIIAWIELKSVKQTTAETQKTVDNKIGEINKLLSYAEIEKHIQICSSISLCLKAEQFEAVAMKLDDLKKTLLEIKNKQSIAEKKDYKIQTMVMRLGNDITAVRNKWTNLSDFDYSIVLEHVDEVSTFMQDISAKLKHQTI